MNLSGQISIIMPSYQQCDFIEGAARSVLDQGGVDLELLIMEPGSTDGLRGGLVPLRQEYGEQLGAAFATARKHVDELGL